MATNDYESQLEELEGEKYWELDKVDKEYSDRIAETDAFYDSQIDAVQDYMKTQSEIQQQQTDFTISQINQKKEQAQKNYTNEQSAAYTDLKKQTDSHGVNAEQIAAGGMWGSGYSESTQTAMYNEYQQRVATAKASFDLTVQNFNNAITQAQLQNNAALAEIAYTSMSQVIGLTMQAFMSKNALLEEQEKAREQVESNYLTALGQLQDNRYGAKPGTGAAFNNLVPSLAREYPYGYITDAAVWQELADTYGEYALRQAGFSNTGPTREATYTDMSMGFGTVTPTGVTIPKGNPANAGGSGKSLEEQLISLGYSGISPEELLRKKNSGEIIVTQNADGSFTLTKGEKTENRSYNNLPKPGGALGNTDQIDVTNSRPAAVAPNIAPPAQDPAAAGGQALADLFLRLIGYY